MLKQLIEWARAGDDVAARALVGWLAECLERGEPPPLELTKYFTQAFQRIAAGRSADLMLNLGKHSDFERDYEIARAVWLLTKRVGGLRLKGSSKGTDACSLVAERYAMGADNVERIYKKLRRLVEAEFLDDSPSADAEAKHHAQVQRNIVLGKLAEQLKKQGRV